LWTFYVDLLENIGSVENTKAAYEKIMELKIASPQLILNYTDFLR
jgi:pre-mRNA-splicing factor SYF1